MHILILGGTRFVGAAITRAALERDHRVTVFHRGKTNTDGFPDAAHLIGDRDPDEGAGLRALAEAAPDVGWDAVIDVSCYLPRHARASSRLLTEHVPFCCFISTVSVYADFSRPDIDEERAVIELDDPTVEEINGETYGGLKVLCEREVADAFTPGRTCTVRPGLVTGPEDYTDRATYWMQRGAVGERVLAPNPPDEAMQLIDARDLGAFCVRTVEESITGVYNAVGPRDPLTREALIQAGAATNGNTPEVCWTDTDKLESLGVEHKELPLWLPGPEYAGFRAVNNERARAAGLTLRQIADSTRDTLAWLQSTRGLDGALDAGMTMQREDELLARL